jgi:hypothetical protein
MLRKIREELLSTLLDLSGRFEHLHWRFRMSPARPTGGYLLHLNYYLDLRPDFIDHSQPHHDLSECLELCLLVCPQESHPWV